MTRARELAKLANSNVFSVDTSNNVGVNSSTPDAKLDVVGVISATSFSGDGSNLTGIIAGATLNASSGTQRLVVTSQTTGSMTQAATSSDITYNTSTSTLSATQYSGNLSGNVTGLQGTPSITVQDIAAEQISAAGTVTYSSVENVNSVGIITANKGIKVPNYGVNVTGVITATSFQGDGSQLTGVESGTQSFVASGTIPNGSTVIIKSDGTVSTITQSTVGPTAGTEVVYNSGTTQHMSCAYNSSNNKVVIAYSDAGNSNYGTAIVGTVSGNSISFGSEVVYNSAASYYNSCVYDSSNNKVVISYRDDGNSYNGTAIVGTVSGTSISFGSESVFSTTAEYPTTTFVGSGKVVIVYRGSSNYGRARVGTVSGTSISFGSEATFNSSETNAFSSTFDSTNGKVVIVYQDVGNSQYGTAIVGTVSGTSISFGSEVVYTNSTAGDRRFSATFDSTNGKVVIAYRDQTDSNYGKAIVGTVSGTSISFGTPVVFESASTIDFSATFDSTDGKVVIAYRDAGNSDYGTATVGTVSGTSISFGTPVVFNSASTTFVSATYDSTNEKVVVVYKDEGNSNYGTAVIIDTSITITTSLTSENYIGIAAEAIANGATGKITVVGGTNSGQTGLTAAQKYYVQGNGTLGTSAGTPSVVAGTSVSSTKIVVQKS